MSDVPETLEEAAEELLRRLEEAGQTQEFVNIPEDRLIGILHHTVGRKIRNDFGLWQDTKLTNALGNIHADDASTIIIKAAWQEANAKNCVIINQENTMKRKFKIMLAMEDEEGKGTLTPLLNGHIEIDVEDPTGDNIDELKATAKVMCDEIQKSLTPECVLVATNKLLLGEKG